MRVGVCVASYAECVVDADGRRGGLGGDCAALSTKQDVKMFHAAIGQRNDSSRNYCWRIVIFEPPEGITSRCPPSVALTLVVSHRPLIIQSISQGCSADQAKSRIKLEPIPQQLNQQGFGIVLPKTRGAIPVINYDRIKGPPHSRREFIIGCFR